MKKVDIKQKKIDCDDYKSDTKYWTKSVLEYYQWLCSEKNIWL